MRQSRRQTCSLGNLSTRLTPTSSEPANVGLARVYLDVICSYWLQRCRLSMIFRTFALKASRDVMLMLSLA